ncbi:uncharacterized protein LOC129194890 isoform X2 [Dunckerocampus dactyliophorus]|uniref:uncharacterized protein LOC129194890 isoform X2 n=1 Tax=Dunckerocampus dactyliophorus TaxID=161453 RepID=UPI0024062E8E|nr:uncharacterized protein LOC129194890 isoform X2 [Dunckerocampus dactyliophorus]
MNWVGGSRSRLILKNDTKKQREFFEKRKMQNKVKNMGVVSSASPKGVTFGSMDLLTLFVVNQIAAKKEHTDPPLVSVPSSKGRGKKRGMEPLVLPMSPCSPSQLSLVDGQPQYSIQGERMRQIDPQAVKIRKLSPVLESAYSDNSGSDYLPPIVDPLSPFSSSSSSSGRFSLQLQAQPPSQWLPSPWDTSGPDQNTFQPYFEPRLMTEGIKWSSGSNLATPPNAKIFVASKHSRHEVTLLHQEQEPMQDFTVNQTRGEQHFEEDVFQGLSTEEYDGILRLSGKATLSFTCICITALFGSEKTKIHLKQESAGQASTPQTVPEPQVIGVQLPNCSNMHFSCPDYPMDGYSPSSSCRRGFLSSDSSDSEECHQPLDQACCSDTTPRINQQQNWDCQTMVKNDTIKSVNTSPLVSPHLRAPTESSERCTCKKTRREMREAESQTTQEMCDAAIQCSLPSENRDPTLALYLSPVDVSLQPVSTRGQTGCTDAPIASNGGRKTRNSNTNASNNKLRLFQDMMRKINSKEVQQHEVTGQQDSLECTSTTKRLSEEAETLEEIANILLLFKQRKEEE